MQYSITQEQLQKVVDYLATRPFVEVFLLINMLQVLLKIESKKDVMQEFLDESKKK